MAPRQALCCCMSSPSSKPVTEHCSVDGAEVWSVLPCPQGSNPGPAEQHRQSTGGLPLAACPASGHGAVPELGWMRNAFLSLPLTRLYVMRPAEPPVCVAWTLATAVPGEEERCEGAAAHWGWWQRGLSSVWAAHGHHRM